MPPASAQLLNYLRRLAPAVPDPGSDAVLLERFTRSRDESAFAALVNRHGPMVFRLCRRLLGDIHRAEDAFQATFLILARRASAIRRPASLSAWLYGVAARVARQAQALQARQHPPSTVSLIDVPDPHPDPLAQVSARDLLTTLEEEVQRLPETYRLPIILCCIEGLSQEEAAQRLGWPAGSVKGRLERGRKRLHQRLTKRGLTLSAALAVVELARSTTAAGPPAALVGLAVKAAAGAAGNSAVPGTVLALVAEESLRGLSLSKLKAVAVILLTLGLVTLAGGAFVSHTPGDAGNLQDRVAKATDRPEKSPEPPKTSEADRQPASPDPPGALPPAEGSGLRAVRPGTLPPRVIHRFGTPRLFVSGGVASIAVSPDGRWLAIGDGRADCVFVWDLKEGKPAWHLCGYGYAVNRLDFSADGRLLMTGRETEGWLGGPGVVWDLQAGKGVSTLAGDGGAVSGDGRSLAVVKHHPQPPPPGLRKPILEVVNGFTVRVLDVARGKERGQFKDGEGVVSSIALSPEGSRVAVGTRSGILSCWDVARGKELFAVRGLRGDVYRVAFSPDGKTLVSTSDPNVPTPAERRLDCWDAQTGQKLRTLNLGRHYHLFQLGFTPAGDLWVKRTHNGPYALHNPETGALLKEYPVEVLAFAAGGKEVVHTGSYSGDYPRTVVREEVATGKRLPLSLSSEQMLPFGFSADGQILYTRSGLRGAIPALRQAWEVRTGAERPHDRAPDKFPPSQSAERSPPLPRFLREDREATYHYTSNTAGYYRVTDPATKQEVFRIDTGRAPRWALAPASGLLAVLHHSKVKGGDGGIRLYDLRDGRELAPIPIPGGRLGFVARLAFTPNGASLAVISYEGYCHLFEVSTARERLRLEEVGQSVFSPDGRLLASTSLHGTVDVFDLTGRLSKGELTPSKLTDAERARHWTALHGMDAAAAHESIWALASDPEATVTFLEARARTFPRLDRDQVARWIADLSSKRFPVRAEAQRQLESLAPLLREELRQARGRAEDLEEQRRLDRLLEQAHPERPAPARLAAWRMVEVLEQIPTPAARRLLAELASPDRPFFEPLAGGVLRRLATNEER
ncbi:MAG: sigma-70 family RNA polymerase sigma factor [Gemmataceae bacterium]|nr:sigma-70 family RNA polymerase sigma factor [Gemmataceae bacterium]